MSETNRYQLITRTQQRIKIDTVTSINENACRLRAASPKSKEE